jgi:hypothetical protein
MSVPEVTSERAAESSRVTGTDQAGELPVTSHKTSCAFDIAPQ